MMTLNDPSERRSRVVVERLRRQIDCGLFLARRIMGGTRDLARSSAIGRP